MFSIKKHKIFEPFFGLYFIWYYLPIARGTYNTSIYNLLFFAFFLCGFLLLTYQIILEEKKIPVRINTLTPILIYMFIAALLYMFDVKDMSKHIRISFTFWGNVIVFYSLSLYKESRVRLVKLLSILFIITAFTSVIGVMIDPHAARTLTYSGNAMEEDIQLKIRNIADIFFFQGLVVFVPICITNMFKKRNILLSIITILFVFFALISASFTIAFIMFFVTLILSIVFNLRTVKAKIMVILIGIVVLFVPWLDVLLYISQNLGNITISSKLETLLSYVRNGIAEGGLSARLDLYTISLKTFLANPWGIGPEYQFDFSGQIIGYHSQILDDLARYGVAAIIFYIVLFKQYHKLLKNQWRKVGLDEIATPILIVYCVFLTLNPGFTSPYEGVLMFLILPTIPEMHILKKGSFGCN